MLVDGGGIVTRSMKRWAPVYSLAVRGSRLLRDERAEHAGTRQRLATALAAVEHHRAQLADAEARCRRLEDTLDFLARGRTRAMER